MTLSRGLRSLVSLGVFVATAVAASAHDLGGRAHVHAGDEVVPLSAATTVALPFAIVLLAIVLRAMLLANAPRARRAETRAS